VKEIARAKGILHDAAAVGNLTASVAKLYTRGMRDRDELLSAAMESYSALVTSLTQATSNRVSETAKISLSAPSPPLRKNFKLSDYE